MAGAKNDVYIQEFQPRNRMASSQAKSLKSSLGEEKLKEIFKAHDVNRDGHLNKEELKKAFGKLGAFIPRWRAGQAIYYADIDIDGEIDERELEEVVDYAVECGYNVD